VSTPALISKGVCDILNTLLTPVSSPIKALLLSTKVSYRLRSANGNLS